MYTKQSTGETKRSCTQVLPQCLSIGVKGLQASRLHSGAAGSTETLRCKARKVLANQIAHGGLATLLLAFLSLLVQQMDGTSQRSHETPVRPTSPTTPPLLAHIAPQLHDF